MGVDGGGPCTQRLAFCMRVPGACNEPARGLMSMVVDRCSRSVRHFFSSLYLCLWTSSVDDSSDGTGWDSLRLKCTPAQPCTAHRDGTTISACTQRDPRH